MTLLWRLQDAVGSRATLGLKDGRSWRIALPFRPTHLLPRLALDALCQALEPPLWHTLLSSHLLCPGARDYLISMPSSSHAAWQEATQCGYPTSLQPKENSRLRSVRDSG